MTSCRQCLCMNRVYVGATAESLSRLLPWHPVGHDEVRAIVGPPASERDVAIAGGVYAVTRGSRCAPSQSQADGFFRSDRGGFNFFAP
jgi:hypothetical protein